MVRRAQIKEEYNAMNEEYDEMEEEYNEVKEESEDHTSSWPLPSPPSLGRSRPVVFFAKKRPCVRI